MTTPARTTLRRASRFTIVPEQLIRDRLISDRGVRLWMLLDREAAGREVAFPSRAMLAEMLDCSRESVDRAVRDLCSAGWLAKERADRGDVNAYVLLEGPVVTSDDTPSRHQGRHPSSSTTTPVVIGDAQRDEREQENTPPAPQGTPSAERKGARLPDGWQPDVALLAWAAAKGLTEPAVLALWTERFVNHWTASAGRNATKRDWGAAWRNWVLEEVTRAEHRAPHGQSTDVFAAAEARALAAERAMMMSEPLALTGGAL